MTRWKALRQTALVREATPGGHHARHHGIQSLAAGPGRQRDRGEVRAGGGDRVAAPTSAAARLPTLRLSGVGWLRPPRAAPLAAPRPRLDPLLPGVRAASLPLSRLRQGRDRGGRLGAAGSALQRRLRGRRGLARPAGGLQRDQQVAPHQLAVGRRDRPPCRRRRTRPHPALRAVSDRRRRDLLPARAALPDPGRRPRRRRRRLGGQGPRRGDAGALLRPAGQGGDEQAQGGLDRHERRLHRRRSAPGPRT